MLHLTSQSLSQLLQMMPLPNMFMKTGNGLLHVPILNGVKKLPMLLEQK
jgi:hypothetical protein